MNFYNKLQLAYSKMKEAKHILIIGHTFPDADALSSISAFLEIAESLGLDVSTYANKKIGGAYDFIPRGKEISSQEPVDLLLFDLIIIVDCGSISRTNLESRIRALLQASQENRLAHRPYLIEFDHHQPQEKYADLEIRLPEKASTTEIIYHFLKANNLSITKTLADCILIGLLTDTGHFLHTNSSKEAIAIASEMLLRGASLPKIISHTVNNKSFSALKVWGKVIENIHFNKKTGFIFSSLNSSELKKLLSSEESLNNIDLFGDIVSFLSNLKGVKVALLVREEDGLVKGSLRTNDNQIDLTKIAKNWNGGGHKKAAGFSIPGKLFRKGASLKIVH